MGVELSINYLAHTNHKKRIISVNDGASLIEMIFIGDNFYNIFPSEVQT